MVLVAFLGYYASKTEHKGGLTMYAVLCGIFMAIFLLFTVLLNFGSQLLQIQFEGKCYQIMPYFHKQFYQSFGCMNKYIQNSTSIKKLNCSKMEIVSIWETNEGVDVFDQSDFYGCLNENCCNAMISVVKEKFNFLSAFCIVAFFFIMVAIITSLYMRKKIAKFENAQILSHKNDGVLFILMLLFTGILLVSILRSHKEGPSGWPQAKQSQWEVKTTFEKTYDIDVDNEIIIGSLNEDGLWYLDMISLYYVDISRCTTCTPDSTTIDVAIQSSPHPGKFHISPTYNQTMKIDINNTAGKVHFYGSIKEVV
mmetsp:Transcript_26314/g.25495  ORF Transcript_26314/g.25495 Transcript_26314/m.25495 type:complete len:310 (-) Transcript_26314:1357-2286(-)